MDAGLQDLEIPVPAVITADLRLNEPRYATLPNLMKAKKKPMEKLDADSLGVDCKPRLNVLKVEEPATRAGRRGLFGGKRKFKLSTWQFRTTAPEDHESSCS